jgi:hypothetical protein
MNHFCLEDWADFTNQTVEADKRALMQQHLEAGCARCAHVLAKWQVIKCFAAQESYNRPPEDAVQAVKKAWKSVGRRPALGPVQLLAELVFDSLRAPALAGVRAGEVAVRRLLYQAAGVAIEISLDSLSDAGHISLTGQIIESDGNGTGIREVPVLLLHGRETIARTQTNEFGEFHLEGEAGKSMQVSVGVSQQKDIFILLDDSIWRTSGEKRPQ